VAYLDQDTWIKQTKQTIPGHHINFVPKEIHKGFENETTQGPNPSAKAIIVFRPNCAKSIVFHLVSGN